MRERIPDLNLFMMCKRPNSKAFSDLERPYYFDLCRRDELYAWMSFPFDDEKAAIKNRDFMASYFHNVYGKNESLFFERCIFVRDRSGAPVGTGFIWKAYGKITTLHWLKVKKEAEGKGIGRAIISHLFAGLKKDDFPVYLHTQPGSFKAIKLYSDFGFRFITDDYVGKRKNGIDKGLIHLRGHMLFHDFELLEFCNAPKEFLQSIPLSDIDEF